jgi:cation diffusion facilitator CzcD-associated flavoprotein CzcO
VFDATAGEWSVDVERDGTPVTLRPKHLVFATGVSGLPVTPTIAGAETFEGEQYHSSRYTSGESYRGKKAVVIGSNNSAHDICADLWEHGADVTLIQRSSTHVARSDTLMELALGALYSETQWQGVSPQTWLTCSSRRFRIGCLARFMSRCTRKWPDATVSSTPDCKKPDSCLILGKMARVCS